MEHERHSLQAVSLLAPGTLRSATLCLRLACLVVPMRQAAATGNDWRQLYGNSCNTNHSACWLQPPLVEVWRTPLGDFPGPGLAADGVWSACLGWDRAVGVSAASGQALWLAGMRLQDSRIRFMLGGRVYFGMPPTRPGREGTYQAVDARTGAGRGELRLASPWPRGKPGRPMRGTPPLPGYPTSLLDDTLYSSVNYWTGSFSATHSDWLWARYTLATFLTEASRRGIEFREEDLAVSSTENSWQLGLIRKPAVSREVVLIGPYRGWVTAFTASAGRELWTASPRTDGVPAVDLTPLPEGRAELRRRLGAQTSAACALLGRAAFVPLGEGGVSAHNALTGAQEWLFKDRWTGAVYREQCAGNRRRVSWDLADRRDNDAESRSEWPFGQPAASRPSEAVLYPSNDDHLYCLDAQTGVVRWSSPYTLRPSQGRFRRHHTVAPVIAMADREEVAYLRDDEKLRAFAVLGGREVWHTEMGAGACAPAVHGGAIYVTSGRRAESRAVDCSVSCFAPMVRLYRLGFALSAAVPPGEDSADPTPPWPEDHEPEILKLPLGLEAATDEAALLEWLKKQTWPEAGCKVLVSLDWLNEGKDGLALPPDLAGRSFADPEIQKLFVERCETLARTFEPTYLDLGPECNFYLRAHAEQTKPMLSVLRQARDRVKRISPKTQVLVSLQYELWQGWNSHLEGVERKPGRLRSVGGIGPEVQLAPQTDVSEWLDALVDSVGISTDPATIAAKPCDLPLDYYYRLRNATKRPLLFTSVAWPVGDDSNREPQGEFLDVFSRRIYWLDPQAVIWPAYDPQSAKALGCEGYALTSAGAAPPQAWQDLTKWRPLPKRPQPGPPIILTKAEEGF